MRYQTTHTRAFHKSLNDFMKLQSHERKAELGFEAQKAKEEAQRVRTERHEMKRQTHYWEVLRRDGQAFSQMMANKQRIEANTANPGFEAELAAELARNGLESNPNHVAVDAA
jgi:hypothetical protein